MLITLPTGASIEGLNRPNTLSLYEEIFTAEVYDFPDLDINDGDTVIDIGANIGLFTLWVLSRAKCRVTCFEPNPEAFALLEHNVPKNVICRNIAIANFNGLAKFAVYPRLPELCTLFPNTNAEEEWQTWLDYTKRRFGWLFARLVRWWLLGQRKNILVSCAKLDTVFSGPIDLLKIDAEKAEQEVMAGISDWSKIKQILVENNLGDVGERQIEQTLNKAGFIVSWHPSTTFIELGCRVAFGKRIS